MLFRSQLFLTVVSISVLIACGGKKGSSAGGTENPIAPPEETPKGETEDPITDQPKVIETGDEIAVKHLIFNASTKTEDFRFLSEFLLVIRSRTDSCVKIKVRPTAGLNPDNMAQQNADLSALKTCDIDEIIKAAEKEKDDEKDANEDDPEQNNEEQDEAADQDENPASLTLYNAEPSSISKLKFESIINSSFSLAAPSVCGRRIFRMPEKVVKRLGDPQGLEKIVTKTARFALKSAKSKVNVWVDEEYANICAGASTPVNTVLKNFGPLHQQSSGLVLVKDKLFLDQLTNLANAAEAAYDQLSKAYGAVSDVDGNSTIDIFISPEVNRHDFVKRDSGWIDDFAVFPISRPQDLSAYNSATNPSSNEGEIIYMWSPDPGGLYNYQIFPSANSLASNMAKGFAAAQIMSLIIHNQHLIVNKTIVEDEFLTESLMFMASQYVGGIDYSKWFLSQYLTSRPQGLSLTKGPNADILGSGYLFGKEEVHGMRAMYGWYLHAKLCGVSSVELCAKFKDLIQSTKVGIENIEAGLSEKFPVILEHFGATVGLSLIDDPAAAIAEWTANPPSNKAIPLLLPSFIEVSKSSPPQTKESNVGATALVANTADRTMASGLPSKKMLIFQPALPDDEMEIKLAEDSVTYILLTGLVEQQTDVTAVFGKGLNVALVPIGERNSNLRRIHKEKLSEQSHLDLRPVNLTDLQQADRTYNAALEYADLDYSVTGTREIWTFGSIDRNSINEAGASVDISDNDSYNFKVNPCSGLTGSALSACAAKDHKVLVQLHIRPSQLELDPMLLVTSTDQRLFKGQSIWGVVQDIDDTFILDPEDDRKIAVLCESEASWTGGTDDLEYRTCANGGLTQAQLQTDVCDLRKNSCENGNMTQQGLYNYYNFITDTGFNVTYDNFLHSSLDFPYYNYFNITYHEAPECPGPRCFIPEEKNRQFFNFSYSNEVTKNPFFYYFFTAGRSSAFPSADSDIKFLSDEEVAVLLAIKDKINDPGEAEPLADDSNFVVSCTSFGFTGDACKNPTASHPMLEDEVKAYVANENAQVICSEAPSTCTAGDLTLAGTGVAGGFPGQDTDPWLTAATNLHYILATDTSAAAGISQMIYTSYYRAVRPLEKDGYCSGRPGFDTEVAAQCRISENWLIEADDIRRQINVPRDMFAIEGLRYDTMGIIDSCREYEEDFEVCGDKYSHYYEINGGKENAQGEKLHVTADYWRLATDRTRQIWSPLGARAMEVVGKPERMHYVNFIVPGNAASYVHVMVGGRDLSQGKYMLRTRLFPSD
ncbi:MAG: hypothetical protein KBD78_13700 [Oligoflexales bacterium]|nr:hypothetical protein [Oligoflexales bacterium]